ncbi:WD repeat-containing protein 18 [Cryptotermes secundus]|uniref:WD repeat-containing protein 18 n=3 Tax=Cryptotermes secundus TaxID=105785 RepID=A0A2J7RSA7_9NEOP|nr:WD repeat-containing protein 18 isoform X1 [Cryptotermes secundus]XP_023727808.1 WD repeat-containing protein 18 isoform X1 [Cryptotermes secundus]PNF43726.1 WD repeat-containing protein 18 [Cryptotermes secundus]
MSNVVEVVVTCEGSGQLWNACMWDPRVGSPLMTYRGGGVAAPHSLCLLGKDYLIISDHTKPVLHAWQLNSQQPVLAKGVRLVCPGCVTSVAVSPDGCYCVTAVAEKLHVWQIASGRHLAVAVRHFQSISCVRFTDDGSHFVSGGEDGLVLVWSLAYLVSNNAGEMISGQNEPRHVFADHSLPVRDLYVGPGGMRARLISVSMDRTCKLYDLASGNLLLSVVYDCLLSAVTMDTTEIEVFVGGSDSNIYQFGLHSPPRMQEYHLSKEEKSKKFAGHTKAVTCLSASVDGVTLLSGSLDSEVMLWHIPSRQCMKVLHHKGPVTNAFFTLAPKCIFSEEMKPTLVLRSFQKSSDLNEEGTVAVSIQMTQDKWYGDDDYYYYDSKSDHMAVTSSTTEDSGLKEQIISLKKINSDLYGFALEKILQPFSSNQTEDVKSNRSNSTQPAASKSLMKAQKLKKKKSKKLTT